MVCDTGSSTLLANANISEGIVINVATAISHLEQSLNTPVNDASRPDLRLVKSLQQSGFLRDIPEAMIARPIVLDAFQV